MEDRPAEPAHTEEQLRYLALENTINKPMDGPELLEFLKNDCNFSFPESDFCMMLLYNRPDGPQDQNESFTKDHPDWCLHWDGSTGQLVYLPEGCKGTHWDEETRKLIEAGFTEFLQDLAICLFLRADRDLCCLMNFPADIDMAALETQIEHAIQFLFDQYGLKLTASLSRIQHGTVFLKAAYEECLWIHDYSWDRDSSVLRYDRLRPNAEQQESLKAETADVGELDQNLVHCVMIRNFSEAGEILNTLNRCLMEQQGSPLETVIIETKHRLRYVMTICGLPAQENCDKLQDLLEQMGHIRSFPHLAKQIQEFFRETDAVLQRKQKDRKGKAQAVVDFIETNYQDPDLGAAMICEKFGISATYLSRVMKEECSMGLVKTIHSIRLREARNLLASTSFSLDEIAERVGFSNRWSLIRVFESTFGIRPSEYRRDSQNS